MPNIDIKQTTIDSFDDMGVSDVSAYLDKIADNHEAQKLDSEFKSKSVADKKLLLKK